MAIAPFHSLRRRRQDEFGAEQRQHLAPFDRHRFRHHQNQFVAARRGDESQRNAGIAGGRLDKHAASGRDLSLRLQSVDHRHADTILDAGDRIEELELGQEMRADALFLGDSIEPDDRRVADRLGDRIIDAPSAGNARPSAARLSNERRPSRILHFAANV